MIDHTVDKSLCAAFGCPCVGTTTSSTGGTDKWFCGYHAGTDAISWQRITTELNRLSFVVDSLRKITRYRGRYEWEKVYREIQNDLRLNQRGDLLRQEHESVSAWYARLDSELESVCKGAQPTLDLLPRAAGPVTDPGASDSWQKASSFVPEPA
jgi:hypothetical protein